MTVLRSPISAHTTVVPVDAPLSSPSYPIFYDLDAETIKVTDGADTTEWQVERGVANTQQAKHAKSVRLVANASPYGGSGGGVNVDNGTDPPAAVTTLVAPGAVIDGDSATTAPAVLSDTDPGAIGAGQFWLQTNAADSFGQQLWLRNAADNGWIAVGPPTSGTFGQTTIGVSSPGDISEITLADVAFGSGAAGYLKVYAPGSLVLQLGTATVQVLTGTADPSAAAGVAANVGSTYHRNNSGTGELWLKIGAAATAWAKVTTA